MNSQILVGYSFDKTHKVILDGVPYAQVKKAYNETKVSDKFSKLEIWSRANGLEKSKHLRRPETSKKSKQPEDIEQDVEIPEGEDFQIEEPVAEKPTTKKKKTKST